MFILNSSRSWVNVPKWMNMFCIGALSMYLIKFSFHGGAKSRFSFMNHFTSSSSLCSSLRMQQLPVPSPDFMLQNLNMKPNSFTIAVVHWIHPGAPKGIMVNGVVPYWGRISPCWSSCVVSGSLCVCSGKQWKAMRLGGFASLVARGKRLF